MHLSSSAIILVHALCAIIAAGTTPFWNKVTSHNLVNNINQAKENFGSGSKVIYDACTALENMTPFLENGNFKLYQQKLNHQNRIVKVMRVQTEDEENAALREIQLFKNLGVYSGRGVEKRRDCAQEKGPCLMYYVFLAYYGVTFEDALNNAEEKKEIQLELQQDSQPADDTAVKLQLMLELKAAVEEELKYCAGRGVRMNNQNVGNWNNFVFQHSYNHHVYKPRGYRAYVVNLSGGTGPPPNGRALAHKVFPKASWTKNP